MKRLMYFFIAIFALSAAGSFFRAGQLINAYDSQTQLVSLTSPYTIALAVVTAVAVLLTLIVSFQKQTEIAADKFGWLVPEALACAALALSSVMGVREYMDGGKLSVLVYAILTAFTALGLIVGAVTAFRRKLSPGYGFYYIIGVFWACFTLVLDFWGHAGNPVWISFVFGMFAFIFMTLSMNAVAGFFFGQSRVKSAVAFSVLGIYSAVVALLGPLLYTWTGNSGVNAGEIKSGAICLFLFAIFHLSAMFASISSGVYSGLILKTGDDDTDSNSADSDYQITTSENIAIGVDDVAANSNSDFAEDEPPKDM